MQTQRPIILLCEDGPCKVVEKYIQGLARFITASGIKPPSSATLQATNLRTIFNTLDGSGLPKLFKTGRKLSVLAVLLKTAVYWPSWQRRYLGTSAYLKSSRRVRKGLEPVRIMAEQLRIKWLTFNVERHAHTGFQTAMTS